MTFKQAKKALKAIAGDKYHSVKFELTEYANKLGFKAQCTLYVDGLGTHFEGATWEEAFEKLDRWQNPRDEAECLSMAGNI